MRGGPGQRLLDPVDRPLQFLAPGVVGGVRGVFFANIGGGSFNCQNYTFATNKDQSYKPVIGYQQDLAGQVIIDPTTGLPIPIYGPTQTITGFRLVDGRASYGIGLETFALGFPIHFDWAWRTLMNKAWEDYLFAYQATVNGYSSGSAWFRKPKFSIWIGYDF